MLKDCHVYPAKTVRVRSQAQIDAEITLGFGVSILSRVLIRGAPISVSNDQYPAALHAMITLLGGKELLIQADPRQRAEMVVSTVALDDPPRGSPPPEALIPVCGRDPLLLDVGAFASWLAERDWKIELVWGVLNRAKNGIAVHV